MIDVTLLGTSALLPLPNRALTAAVLFCGGHSILFDCGEGTQVAARRAGVSLMKTDIIALTHYHGDHIFGLLGLTQTMHSLGRKETLYITGPEGLEKTLEPVLKLVRWTDYEIKLFSLPKNGLRLSEFIHGWAFEAKLSAFKTEHNVPSQGYCFTLGRAGKFMPQRAQELNVPVTQWGVLQKGGSVQVGDKIIFPEQVLGEPRKGLKFIFTGDTTKCDSLVEAAKGADLMICEGTYGKNEKEEVALRHGHMTFSQAAEMAKRAEVNQLWLAHYSQTIRDPRVYLENATKIFPNTICGRDGMSTTLHFQD